MINLNLLADLQQMWSFEFMQHAFEAGTIVAIIAGITGYFVVLRRSAFTAHAFSEIGFAGAAGAVLLETVGWNVPPIAGLLLGSTLGGLTIAALGRRAANRDTQIGIVLASALGLGLLFISLYAGYATEAYSILFGEILGISSSEVVLTLIAGVLIIGVVAVLYRPLLFASLDEDVAEAKGIPMLFIGTAFMLVVAVAVSFAVQVTGVLLIFSLMVTPAATAQYLSRRPQRAIIISVGIALTATWAGLFVAYYTPFPVSFFITAIVFGLYLLARGLRLVTGQRLPRSHANRDL
ncbi:MAG TPA: metal ABC transporter permease [Nitrososphaerales archaeon]|nr:metal ABC transporter permease [Nitrososphaerales archaeon]